MRGHNLVMSISITIDYFVIISIILLFALGTRLAIPLYYRFLIFICIHLLRVFLGCETFFSDGLDRSF